MSDFTTITDPEHKIVQIAQGVLSLGKITITIEPGIINQPKIQEFADWIAANKAGLDTALS